jgi:hypothetical protein
LDAGPQLKCDDVDVSAEMVKRGGAWTFTRYQSDPRFSMWQQEAVRTKKGLWSLQPDQIQAPWDWRASKRGVASVSTVAQARTMTLQSSQIAKSSSFSCGKRTCSQMNSCAEAVYALRQCGISQLDSDRDGKPCEKLCS